MNGEQTLGHGSTRNSFRLLNGLFSFAVDSLLESHTLNYCAPGRQPLLNRIPSIYGAEVTSLRRYYSINYVQVMAVVRKYENRKTGTEGEYQPH